MRVIFLLVDAMKSLYISENNTPYLFKLRQDSYVINKISQGIGFCERSEIFTGLDGYDTGNFTAIGFMPDSSCYKMNRLAIIIADVASRIYERGTHFIFEKYASKVGKRLKPYRIPYKSLHNFDLTEDGNIKLTSYRTIFDVLKEHGKKYNLSYFTSLSDKGKRCNKPLLEFTAECISESVDFIPLYIPTIDSAGHSYGEDIESIKPYLNEIDRTVENLHKLAMNSHYSLIVLGDHGMVPITQRVDIRKAVVSTGLKLGKDYEMFLDSTVARFWFFKSGSEEVILNAISKFSDFGIIVNNSNYKEHRIPLDLKSKDGKSIYGDMLWCANPEVLISPDYFNSPRKTINGMHGYIKNCHAHSYGTLVAWDGVSTGFVDEASLSDVCRVLCDAMSIPLPNDSWERIPNDVL